MHRTTFVITQILPEGVGHQRHLEGLVMTGPEVAATLADSTTCEDLIHEAEECGLRAVECWHLRPYLPAGMRERYDAERAVAAAPMVRHVEGLVWFRGWG
ncbi:hypothetical protein [Nocardiopsis synnemataformans]|uniref:hypothetical protein n=1 Tax=Nocardiopsis synnemataformans TaxID=61305 RepID=UPI003EB7873C